MMEMGEIIREPRRVAEPKVMPTIDVPERILAPIFAPPQKVAVPVKRS